MCIRHSNQYNHCSHTVNDIIECEAKLADPSFKCKLEPKGVLLWEFCPPCEDKREEQEAVKRASSFRGKLSRLVKKLQNDDDEGHKSFVPTRKGTIQAENSSPLPATVGRGRATTFPANLPSQDVVASIAKRSSAPIGAAAAAQEIANPRTITSDKIASATAKLFTDAKKCTLVQYSSGNTEYIVASSNERHDSQHIVAESVSTPRSSFDHSTTRPLTTPRNSIGSHSAARSSSTPKSSMDYPSTKSLDKKPRVVSTGSEKLAEEYRELIGTMSPSSSPKLEEKRKESYTHVSSTPDAYRVQSEWEKRNHVDGRPPYLHDSPPADNSHKTSSQSKPRATDLQKHHAQELPPVSRVSSQSNRQVIDPKSYRAQESPPPSWVSSRYSWQETKREHSRVQESASPNEFEQTLSSTKQHKREKHPASIIHVSPPPQPLPGKIDRTPSSSNKQEREPPPTPQAPRPQTQQGKKSEPEIDSVGKRRSPRLQFVKVQNRKLPTVTRKPPIVSRRLGIEADRMSMMTTFSSFIPEPISQNVEARREGSRLQDGTFDHRRISQERPKRFVTKPDSRSQIVSKPSRSPRVGSRSPRSVKLNGSSDLQATVGKKRPVTQWPGALEAHEKCLHSMTGSHGRRPSPREVMRGHTHQQQSSEGNETEQSKPVTQSRSDREQTFDKQYPTSSPLYTEGDLLQHTPTQRLFDSEENCRRRQRRSAEHLEHSTPRMNQPSEGYCPPRQDSQQVDKNSYQGPKIQRQEPHHRESLQRQISSSTPFSHQTQDPQSPHASVSSRTTHDLASSQNTSWRRSQTFGDELRKADEKHRREMQLEQEQKEAKEKLQTERDANAECNKAEAEKKRLDVEKRKEEDFLDKLRKAHEKVARVRDMRGYVDYSHNRHPDDKGRPPPPPSAPSHGVY